MLAVAEDGSAVVPLLGGLGGVNVMAREIAAGLGVAAAITTSGELRFGTCLLNPPSGYALGDLELGKRFVSDLLGGESVHIEGAAPWLAEARLPQDQQARLTIRVGSAEREPAANELLIYPRSVLIACNGKITGAAALRDALHQKQIAVQSVACLLAADSDMASPILREAAAELGVPLRFAPAASSVAELAQQAVPQLLPPLSVGKTSPLPWPASRWTRSRLAAPWPPGGDWPGPWRRRTDGAGGESRTGAGQRYPRLRNLCAHGRPIPCRPGHALHR